MNVVIKGCPSKWEIDDIVSELFGAVDLKALLDTKMADYIVKVDSDRKYPLATFTLTLQDSAVANTIHNKLSNIVICMKSRHYPLTVSIHTDGGVVEHKLPLSDVTDISKLNLNDTKENHEKGDINNLLPHLFVIGFPSDSEASEIITFLSHYEVANVVKISQFANTWLVYFSSLEKRKELLEIIHLLDFGGHELIHLPSLGTVELYMNKTAGKKQSYLVNSPPPLIYPLNICDTLDKAVSNRVAQDTSQWYSKLLVPDTVHSVSSQKDVLLMDSIDKISQILYAQILFIAQVNKCCGVIAAFNRIAYNARIHAIIGGNDQEKTQTLHNIARINELQENDKRKVVENVFNSVKQDTVLSKQDRASALYHLAQVEMALGLHNSIAYAKGIAARNSYFFISSIVSIRISLRDLHEDTTKLPNYSYRFQVIARILFSIYGITGEKFSDFMTVLKNNFNETHVLRQDGVTILDLFKWLIERNIINKSMSVILCVDDVHFVGMSNVSYVLSALYQAMDASMGRLIIVVSSNDLASLCPTSLLSSTVAKRGVHVL